MYKGPIDKAKGARIEGVRWEWVRQVGVGGVGGTGESRGRKMDTTVLEQQEKKF